MENDEKIQLESLYEILQDNFIMVFLGRVLLKFKNKESQLAVEEFISSFSPVVIHETYIFLKNNKLVEEDKFFKNNNLKKKIAEYRMNTIKKKTLNSNYINTILENMGITFNENIYDINIIEKNNEIKRFNFSGYIKQQDNDFFRSCYLTNEEIAKVTFKEILNISNEDFENLLNKIVELECKKIEKLDDTLAGNRFSYKSSKLFSRTIIDDIDKIFILYRYNMISIIGEISKFLEQSEIKIKQGDRNIVNIDKYILKMNALEIDILGLDIRKIESKFILDLREKLDKKMLEIDKNFYSNNIKIRNNIHYSKIEHIDDMDKLLDMQKEYFKIISENILENLYFEIDEEDIRMNDFFQYCIKNDISQEEINMHYEDYYTQYYYNKKIIRK